MKKTHKLSALILSVIIVLSILPVMPLAAFAETDGVFNCAVENGKATITELVNKSYSGKLTIPSKIEGFPVTSIGFSAFSGCGGITSVTIPDGVESVGAVAFLGCTGLKSITVPGSVTSIGNNAFYGCGGFKTAGPIGGGYDYEFGWTKNIPDSAFYGCTGLTSMIIPDSVTSIGNNAFYGCAALKSITMGKGVTSIGDGAFTNCIKLTKVNYRGNIEDWCRISFSDYDSNPLFYTNNLYIGDESVTDLIIPGSITAIGNYAFFGCAGLTSVTIPDSVSSVGNNAFEGCAGLESVIIGNGVTSIGKWAFDGCAGLTSVTIGNSVTSIGEGAFRGCTRLTSITVPVSVLSIGSSAFWGCTSLTEITLPFVGNYRYNNESAYQAPFGYIFGTSPYTGGISTNQCNYYSSANPSITREIFYIPSSLKKVTITDCNYIQYGAFYNCSGLTSVVIPHSVKTIGDSAFFGCTGLADVYYTGTEKQKSAISINNENGKNDNLLNAKWYYNYGKKYSITYNLNGGKNDSANRNYYIAGKADIALKNPTKKGYTFSGWYNGSKKVTKIDKSSTGNITLTAKWSKDTYKITYKLAGGKNAKNPTKYTVTTSTVKLKDPTRKGYKFKGWYNGKKKVTEIKKGSTGNITLTAKWTAITYKITYKLNKGKNNSKNPKSYKVTTSTIKLKDPTRKGYTFKGWYADSKKVTTIKKGSTGSITLTAKWKKK